ncbi:MAG TPA: acyl-CoA dehydrogenase family protein [Stellaceae bacterium]|nr:acyl-CoA dehydrogenase family protein [Stellaceae bacterium]
MDFDDLPEEAAFRAEVRDFLDANAERRTGAERIDRSHTLDAAAIARAKVWQAKKADAGFAAITWPVRYGGRGGSMVQQIIYSQEEERYVTPRSVFNQGIGLAIPTMMAYGAEAMLERYARPAMRGEEVWCQLFSEPAAGSDLAGLRTQAVRHGDEWIVNGQKIWTSNAHFSDFGVLVTRSDPTVPKHAGLTYFIVDMKSPGIEARPIKQIYGTSNFNEVFLTDVRIPDANRIGEVGAGWKVATTTLMNERFTVAETEGPDFDDIFALAGELDARGDPAVRQRLADWYVRSRGLKLIRLRSFTALSQGRQPGPESSIGKLVSATRLQEVSAFGMELMGMGGTMMDPALVPMDAWFQGAFLYSPSKRISGGTDEILRNIIAERVLGLPGDVRADKNLPFNRIPTGRR